MLLSDRALKIAWVLRPYHEMQIAQAVYAALLRPELAARESSNETARAQEVARSRPTYELYLEPNR